MAIGTDRNTAYGSSEVTNKYSPLRSIVFHSSDQASYNFLMLNRWRLLNSAAILPQPLHLTVSNWTSTITDEAGKNPPLLVISSNRSEWIKAGLTAAGTQPAYENASDLRALTFDNSYGASPPIYSPRRLGNGGARNVYIVVHQYEYETYQKNLADLGVKVVGWTFRVPGSSAARLTGFGASRFAAIEFCKELRRARAALDGGRAPWNYAWLLDDNVVALSKFPGYRAVENAMTERHVCAGFTGCTILLTLDGSKSWAQKEDEAGRGHQATALPGSETPNLVQQAALWNIDYLTTQKLNFGPAFVLAGEDVSLSAYFNKFKTPYFFYKDIDVIKQQASADDSAGSESVKRAREHLSGWFAESESSEPTPAPTPPPPPPPIKVQGTRGGESAVQTIANYIVKYVLPGCGKASEIRKDSVVNTAKCQAAEQIMSGAIDAKGVTVSTEALESTFRFNGNAATSAQAIVRFDKPPRT